MKVQHMLESAIIDTEVVAFDVAQQVRLPFQVLSTRSRKNVKLSEIKVPVCIYAFDLLYLNGESYLKETLTTRRKVLRESFEILPHRFEYATSFDVDVSQEEQDDSTSSYFMLCVLNELKEHIFTHIHVFTHISQLFYPKTTEPCLHL